jgi:DNA-binding beta-propeller fold protein YncE
LFVVPFLDSYRKPYSCTSFPGPSFLHTPQFNGPAGVSIAPSDPTFAVVADQYSHRIRRIDTATGRVTTLAGSSQGAANGAGINAQFNQPQGVAIAPDRQRVLLAVSDETMGSQRHTLISIHFHQTRILVRVEY